MKLLLYLFICNSIILFAQQDTTEIITDENMCSWPHYDSQPRIIGGIESIQNRLVYPPNALERKVEGNVYVLVNVDSLGNPYDPFLIKGIGVGCDEEAIRLVKTAKFSPAMQNFRAIKCQTVVPIKFRLPKNE